MANPFDQFDQNPFDQFDGGTEQGASQPETKAQEEPSIMGRLGRQFGLAGRYAIEGIGGVAQMVSEPVRQAVNVIPGVDIARSSPSDIPNALGMPSPHTGTERVVGEASRTLAGVGPFLKGAQIASMAAGPVVNRLGAAMSSAPMSQAVSAGSAGGASGIARESGAGPGGQLAASLAGATSPVLLGKSVLPAAANKQLQSLVKEGVRPTIGQAIGGRTGALEEKLTSLPVMGDAISTTRQRAVEQFNKAAINRALKPIGQFVDEVGTAGVKKAGDILSAAYDDAISKIRFVRADKNFTNSLAQGDIAAGLEPAYAKKFSKLVSEKILPNIERGVMSGEKFKAITSDLGNESAKFSKYQNSAARDYGMVVEELKGLLTRQASKHANKSAVKAIKDADKGYANLIRVELASKAAKNADGVFTPAQLNMAVQQADKSVRGRSVSRGTSLMQDLSGAGQNVLGSKVPTSGTAERLFYGAGTAGAAMVEPTVLGGLLGGAAAYTPPVQNMLVRGLMARPEYSTRAGEALGQNIPFIAAQQR